MSLNQLDDATAKLFIVYKEIYNLYGDSFTNQIFDTNIFFGLIKSWQRKNKLKFQLYDDLLKQELIPAKTKLRELVREQNTVVSNSFQVFDDSNYIFINKEFRINFGRTIPPRSKRSNLIQLTNLTEKRMNILIGKKSKATNREHADIEHFLNLQNYFL